MSILHRRRKVLNIGGCGGGEGARFRILGVGWGGEAMGATLFAGCKMIGAPPPISAK